MAGANVLTQLLGIPEPQAGEGTPQALTVRQTDQDRTSLLDDLLNSVKQVAVRRFLQTDVGQELQAEAARQTVTDTLQRVTPLLVIGLLITIGVLVVRR